VYGLGANALDAKAVRYVFEVKERPLTDPLIVHVLDAAGATDLIDVTEAELLLFSALGRRFWPGPLTCIVSASAAVPSLVTADTGKVGIRVPAHPVARALLAASKLPIAAPSANLFGHVSPTRCAHVLADLGDKDVHVLHGEYDGGNRYSHSISTVGGGVLAPGTSCEHGIESTVLKIDGAAQQVSLLRHGSIGAPQILAVLQEVRGIDKNSAWTLQDKSTRRVIYTSKCVGHVSSAGASVVRGEEAPGQSLTHYAPKLPCYVAVHSSSDSLSETRQLAPEGNGAPLPRLLHDDLAHAVVLDFHQKLSHNRHAALAYLDLSESGCFVEAAACVFDSLRWAELQSEARMVILPDLDLQSWPRASTIAVARGLHDRLHRASSGRFIAV